MIIFLLILIVLIMLFGANTVKSSVASGCLVSFGLVGSVLAFIFLMEFFEKTKWYIAIPVTLVVLCVFTWMVREKKEPAKPNATFKVFKDGRISLIMISQNDKTVLLNPREVKQMLHGWDVINNKHLDTVFGTFFEFNYVHEVFTPEIAKSLAKKGITSYTSINQTRRLTLYQTGDTVNLNNTAVIELKSWIENIKNTDSFIKQLYDADL